MLYHQKQKKLESFCGFIWQYEKYYVPCTRFSGARQFENGALIALAGKIIATDTRWVVMSIGRLGAGPPYDKGKGQIIIGASPKLPSARSLFSNHSNP